jgi:hypothetical protein
MLILVLVDIGFGLRQVSLTPPNFWNYRIILPIPKIYIYIYMHSVQKPKPKPKPKREKKKPEKKLNQIQNNPLQMD